MEKIYIVCRKVNALCADVLEGAFDDYVLKSGNKDEMGEYFRDLAERAKKRGMKVTSGINENGVVWNRFEKNFKTMTVWFCNKSQAKQMLVEVD